jgi:hypothetical protein
MALPKNISYDYEHALPPLLHTLRKIKKQTTKINDSDCYLETPLLQAIKEKVPVAFARKNVIDGKKVLSSNSTVSLHRLLAGPVATDSSTMINFEQHFVRGCSYTVALWIWIWKSKRLGSVNQPEHVVFSTRETFPRLLEAEAVLPSIVFNTGLHPERFFFSATRDDYGHYHGFWPRFDIRYNEWMHVALTLDGSCKRM